MKCFSSVFGCPALFFAHRLCLIELVELRQRLLERLVQGRQVLDNPVTHLARPDDQAGASRLGHQRDRNVTRTEGDKAALKGMMAVPVAVKAFVDFLDAHQTFFDRIVQRLQQTCATANLEGQGGGELIHELGYPQDLEEALMRFEVDDVFHEDTPLCFMIHIFCGMWYHFKDGKLVANFMTPFKINELAETNHAWVERMGWHNKSTLECFALIASEVGEAIEALLYCKGNEAIGEELADIILRVSDLAVDTGRDLDALVEAANPERNTLYASEELGEIMVDVAHGINACRKDALGEDFDRALGAIVVRVMEFADRQEIDLKTALQAKMDLNAMRGTRGRRI